MDRDEARQMMDGKGFTPAPMQQTSSTQQTAASTDSSNYSDNGYYELMECKVIKLGELVHIQQHVKQTITFSYQTKKGGEAQVCCEAWNDQLNHNDFQTGAYYDITLRVGCRTSTDGRDFPVVSLVYAHRLRTIQMV